MWHLASGAPGDHEARRQRGVCTHGEEVDGLAGMDALPGVVETRACLHEPFEWGGGSLPQAAKNYWLAGPHLMVEPLRDHHQ